MSKTRPDWRPFYEDDALQPHVGDGIAGARLQTGKVPGYTGVGHDGKGVIGRSRPLTALPPPSRRPSAGPKCSVIPRATSVLRSRFRARQLMPATVRGVCKP